MPDTEDAVERRRDRRREVIVEQSKDTSKGMSPASIGALVLAGVVSLFFIGPKVVEEQQTKDILQLPALTGRVNANEAAIDRQREVQRLQLEGFEKRHQLDRARSDAAHEKVTATLRHTNQRELTILFDKLQYIRERIDTHIAEHNAQK